jgi:ABC-type Fe3+ transport system substrate-binding protein
MTLIEKGFEGKYGLKIEYWRADATKVIDRVLTEWRAGKPGFDLVIGARGALLLGKEENIFAKFVPTNTANFPAKFKDADGKLTAWRVTPVGVLYNTELVKVKVMANMVFMDNPSGEQLAKLQSRFRQIFLAK